MRYLELLAPARNSDIGIAAIDCGADAVYIGGPGFGARKDAGNSLSDIERLCAYAHTFGARIFLTVNVTLEEGELEEVHDMMLRAQEAGVDAFIVRDPVICTWEDITVPLHASTQCALRQASKAREYHSLGFSRLVLERQLSLDQVREVAAATDAELEFFVHGALCTGYSGDCYLSEALSGRSANRGECIQACRSLYDLADAKGNILIRNKALLSLKDFNLLERMEDLAEAGVCSFKIEGRLKSISYVKNVVREYSLALDRLVEKHPDKYARASFGTVRGGFVPDSNKTFNRGYTQLFLDGKRGRWASMDAPKSMGECIGKVLSIQPADKFNIRINVKPLKGVSPLNNGDGFCFVDGFNITGFRGDVCNGYEIRCKNIAGLKPGDTLYRNINAAFEKELQSNMCQRLIPVGISLRISGSKALGYKVEASAASQDGRSVSASLETAGPAAQNKARMESILQSQLSKTLAPYILSPSGNEVLTADGSLPLLSASALNGLCRSLAAELDKLPCGKVPLCGAPHPQGPVQKENAAPVNGELMRSKYCIRYELGICPVHQGAAESGPLFLLNNGRRFALGFDCKHCEMTVKEA